MKTVFICLLLTLLNTIAAPAPPGGVVHEGSSGPGRGKHIVLIAGDHEYRSEETLPALARILAKHHGFKCTTIFTVHPITGFIDPAADHLPGAAALKDADLMVLFTRFKDLPDEQMRHVADFIERGGPVIGLRTATHAFKIDDPTKRFARFSFHYPGRDFGGGFGRQILGETWAGHYGRNHVQSSRLFALQSAKDHPILRGVTDIHTQAGAYWANPESGSEILAVAQPLNGLKADAPIDFSKRPTPAAWARTYRHAKGEARVFTTTQGASEDLPNPGFRRMLVNACFWATGLEDQITPDLKTDFVGPYHPATYRFEGHRRGVYPEDLQGWESPIMDPALPVE
jgi:type 1 glutamine amidotransferase